MANAQTSTAETTCALSRLPDALGSATGLGRKSEESTMTQTIYYRCPKCDHEHSAEFDLGEHFMDNESECESCSHKFTEAELQKIQTDAEIDAVGAATNAARDRDR
jgi:transcription elongation factor Elf1